MEKQELSIDEKARLARREYKRKYLANPKNRAHRREYERLYWAKKYDEMKKEKE